MSRVARWVPPASLVLALVGLGASIYLTIAHFTSPDVLACPANGTIDCALVTTSAQSRFLGIPVAVLGLAWFAGMTGLCVPAAWNSERRLVHLARLAGSVAGVAFVLWLVYAELFIIGAICEWCTVAHVCAFGLFVIAVLTAPPLLGEPLEE
ncbi:MAG TPA: vitamin K epoxide reductase family protein [Actinomycetota bacterium]|nr:vitamin K epoxide reductase family protein [Actinomycetota bacterium]